MYEYAPKLETALKTDSAAKNLVQDVTSDLLITNPQVNVDIDRDKASALGLTANQIEDALFTAYGPRQISTIYAPSNTYRVVTQLEDQYQLDPSALSLIYVRSKGGQLVPLNTVASLRRTLGPLTINHLGQLGAVTLSFNLRPGVALGDAVNVVNRLASQILPATVSTTSREQRRLFSPPSQV
jgi:HAE1 family hydrophobic/amphiphilic exporter-1